MSSVVVVGSINVDVVMHVPGFPVPGVTLLADRVERSPGGKGANQAVAAARAGAATRLLGAVGDDGDSASQVDALVTEALAVCERAGITLVRPPGEAVDEAITEAYDHKPSMLQDVLARRPTEIDVLNGGIAAEGRRAGVPTPRHDSMVALVKGLEKSWSG